MAAWVSIILGLAGAFIGASGAVGGQWLSARRQDARESRQRQFQAGADLLSAAYGFMGSASGLQTLLETPELASEVHAAYQRYLGRWDAYIDKFGVARLAAHPEVVHAARQLESSLYDCRNRLSAGTSPTCATPCRARIRASAKPP